MQVVACRLARGVVVQCKVVPSFFREGDSRCFANAACGACDEDDPAVLLFGSHNSVYD